MSNNGIFKGTFVPNGWVRTEIEQIALKIHYGYTAIASEQNTGVKYLRITDITDDGVNWSNVPFCKIDAEEVKKYQLEENDIVFARTGGTVGKSFMIKNDVPPKTVFASYLIRIKVSKSINPRLVAYYFQSKKYWQYIEINKTGLKTNVNAQILSKIEFDLPPFNEQNQIVIKLDELLSELDKGNDLLHKSLEQSKTYRKSVLHTAIEGNYLKKDCQWITKTLGDVISISSGNMLSKTSRNDSGDHLVYGGNGVTGKHDHFMFDEPKLIIGRVGAHCGNVHITAKRSWVTDNAFVVSFNEKEYDLKYLYYLISYLDLNKYSSSTAQPVISQTKIYPLEVKVPELSAQKEIVAFLEAQYTNCDHVENVIQQSILQSNLMRESLLQQAFEGKLVRQDPNDEPAIVLLEKIKKEKHEFLQIENERKKTEKSTSQKTNKMADQLSTIMQLLEENNKRVPAKELWQLSKYKNDIDEFYAEVKKLIEQGEIVESRKGKISFLELAKTK